MKKHINKLLSLTLASSLIFSTITSARLIDDAGSAMGLGSGFGVSLGDVGAGVGVATGIAGFAAVLNKANKNTKSKVATIGGYPKPAKITSTKPTGNLSYAQIQNLYIIGKQGASTRKATGTTSSTSSSITKSSRIGTLGGSINSGTSSGYGSGGSGGSGGSSGKSKKATNALKSKTHKHKFTWKTTKKATCVENGKKVLKCSCGKVNGSKVIKAKKHAYVSAKAYKKSLAKAKKQKFAIRFDMRAKTKSDKNKEYNDNLMNELEHFVRTSNFSSGYSFGSTGNGDDEIEENEDSGETLNENEYAGSSETSANGESMLKDTDVKSLKSNAKVCKRCGKIKFNSHA